MRSNTSEWSTTLKLIKRITTTDSDGFETYVETSREVFCNFSIGVSRNEFYEAYKAGLELSAEVEVWHFDYDGEKIAEVNGVRYKVVRAFPVTLDTVILVLSEVLR